MDSLFILSIIILLEKYRAIKNNHYNGSFNNIKLQFKIILLENNNNRKGKFKMASHLVLLFLLYQLLVGVQTFEFIPPTISALPLTIASLSSYTISANRQFDATLASTPWDSQLVPAGSNISVIFPSQYNIISFTPLCDLVQVNGGFITDPLTCTVSGNQFIIQGAILSAIYISQVSIFLSNVMNPAPALTTGTFVVKIGNDNSQNISGQATVTLEPGTLRSTSVTFNPSVVNTTGSMIVTLLPTNNVSTSGSIKIQFPATLQWTKDLSTNNQLPISGKLPCFGLSANTNNATILCTGVASTQQITITNMLLASTNSLIQISIKGLFSPPTTQPIDTLVIRTYQGVYIIDQKDTVISGLQPQTLAVSISSTSSVMAVNSNGGLRFDFTLSDTISKDDHFQIQFPSGTRISYVRAISSFILAANNTYNSSTRILRVYQSASSPLNYAGTVSFVTFLTYTASASIRPTDPIIFRIHNGLYLKMQGSSTISAIFKNYTLTGSTTVNTVGDVSTYTLVVPLVDALTSSAMFIIKVPSQLILSANCPVFATSTTIKANPSCSISGNQIIVTQIASGSTFPVQTITISISSITNPPSAVKIDDWLVQIYLTTDVIDLVAKGVLTGITIQPGNLDPTKVSIAPSSNVTFDESVSYEFTITANHSIAANGYIQIEFPSQTLLIAPASCSFEYLSTASTTSCTYTAPSKIEIQITRQIPSSASFKVKVNSAVKNPATTKASSTFKIITMNSLKETIDRVLSGIFVAINTPRPFINVSGISQSLKNHQLTSCTFSFSQTAPYSNQSIIRITFPSQISFQSSSSCLDAFGAILACIKNTASKYIDVTLPFPNATAQVSIKISGITNAQSFKPSSAFFFQTFTNQSHFYSDSSLNTAVRITNNVASAFVSVIYNFGAKQFGSTNSNLTLSIQMRRQLETGGKISINLDWIVINAPGVQCQSTGFTPLCNTVNTTIVQILSATTIPASFSVTIKVLTNPSKIPTTNLTIQSYDSSGFLIHSQSTIRFQLECQVPCQKCPTTNISQCLSCYSQSSNITTLIYLFNSQCLATCPSQTFNQNFICLSCNSNCLQCSILATNCTSCQNSWYLFTSTTSQTKSCVKTCPNGYFPDNSLAVPACTLCTNPCVNCLSAILCLSCVDPLYLIQGNQSCAAVCPINISVSNDGNPIKKCLNCSSQCKTCQNTTALCTSCTSPQLLHLNRCIASCPAGFVSNNLIPQNATQCVACLSPCRECSLVQTNCTNCLSQFPFLHLQTCLNKCPLLTFNDTLSSCKLCSSVIPTINCQNCSSSTECLTCDPNFVFFRANKSCLGTVPAGYVNISGIAEACLGDCATCQVTTTNCTSCRTLFLQGNFCISPCSTGKVGINHICQDCTSPCASCQVSRTNCSSCIANYYLNSASNTCVLQCPSTTFASNTSQRCEPCISPCFNCTSSTACITCQIGFLLGTSCTQTCPDGQVGTGSNNNYTAICSNCILPCASCSVTQVNCTKCIADYYLNSASNACVLQCPSTTFASNTSRRCEPCISPCFNCTSSTACISCHSGFLLGTSCLQICPDGQVGTGSNANYTAICQNCQNPCTKCIGSVKNCTQCVAPLFFYDVNQSCINQCPTQITIPNQADRTCSGCLSPCVTCVVSVDSCLTCIPGKIKNGNVCVDSCPDGKFAQNSTCTDCSTANTCLTCSSKTVCTSCSYPFFFYNGTCTLTCPPAFNVIRNNSCTACLTNCVNCSNKDQCYNCTLNHILFNNTCITECPIDYTMILNQTIRQYYCNFTGQQLSGPLSQASVFPLPFTIIGAAVFIACFMSKLQNQNTYLVGLAYCIFGFFQVASIVFLGYQYWAILFSKQQYDENILIMIGAGLGVIYLLNIIGICLQTPLLLWDVYFRRWLHAKNVVANQATSQADLKDSLSSENQNQEDGKSKQKNEQTDCCGHRCSFSVITLVSLFLSYKFKMILFTKLFGFECLSARLENVQQFRLFNLLSFLGILHQGQILYVGFVLITKFSYQANPIIFMAAVDVVIIALLNILLALIASNKSDDFFQTKNTFNEEKSKHKKLQKDINNGKTRYTPMDSASKLNGHNPNEDQQISLQLSKGDQQLPVYSGRSGHRKKASNIFDPSQNQENQDMRNSSKFKKTSKISRANDDNSQVQSKFVGRSPPSKIKTRTLSPKNLSPTSPRKNNLGLDSKISKVKGFQDLESQQVKQFSLKTSKIKKHKPNAQMTHNDIDTSEKTSPKKKEWVQLNAQQKQLRQSQIRSSLKKNDANIVDNKTVKNPSYIQKLKQQKEAKSNVASSRKLYGKKSSEYILKQQQHKPKQKRQNQDSQDQQKFEQLPVQLRDFQGQNNNTQQNAEIVNVKWQSAKPMQLQKLQEENQVSQIDRKQNKIAQQFRQQSVYNKNNIDKNGAIFNKESENQFNQARIGSNNDNINQSFQSILPFVHQNGQLVDKSNFKKGKNLQQEQKEKPEKANISIQFDAEKSLQKLEQNKSSISPKKEQQLQNNNKANRNANQNDKSDAFSQLKFSNNNLSKVPKVYNSNTRIGKLQNNGIIGQNIDSKIVQKQQMLRRLQDQVKSRKQQIGKSVKRQRSKQLLRKSKQKLGQFDPLQLKSRQNLKQIGKINNLDRYQQSNHSQQSHDIVKKGIKVQGNIFSQSEEQSFLKSQSKLKQKSNKQYVKLRQGSKQQFAQKASIQSSKKSQSIRQNFLQDAHLQLSKKSQRVTQKQSPDNKENNQQQNQLSQKEQREQSQQQEQQDSSQQQQSQRDKDQNSQQQEQQDNSCEQQQNHDQDQDQNQVSRSFERESQTNSKFQQQLPSNLPSQSQSNHNVPSNTSQLQFRENQILHNMKSNHVMEQQQKSSPPFYNFSKQKLEEVQSLPHPSVSMQYQQMNQRNQPLLRNQMRIPIDRNQEQYIKRQDEVMRFQFPKQHQQDYQQSMAELHRRGSSQFQQLTPEEQNSIMQLLKNNQKRQTPFPQRTQLKISPVKNNRRQLPKQQNDDFGISRIRTNQHPNNSAAKVNQGIPPLRNFKKSHALGDPNTSQIKLQGDGQLQRRNNTAYHPIQSGKINKQYMQASSSQRSFPDVEQNKQAKRQISRNRNSNFKPEQGQPRHRVLEELQKRQISSRDAIPRHHRVNDPFNSKKQSQQLPSKTSQLQIINYGKHFRGQVQRNKNKNDIGDQDESPSQPVLINQEGYFPQLHAVHELNEPFTRKRSGSKNRKSRSNSRGRRKDQGLQKIYLQKLQFKKK